MNNLITALQRRMTSFEIGFSIREPIDKQIKDCLLNNPDLLGTIESFGVNWNLLTRRAYFNVGYRIDNSEMTIVVRDYFEMLTAITMILKSHKSNVKIIIDNRSGFVSSDTVFEYIQRVRLKEAALLLSQTEMSVIEISEASGFQTLSHFNRSFLNTFGMSPTKYRNNSAKN